MKFTNTGITIQGAYKYKHHVIEGSLMNISKVYTLKRHHFINNNYTLFRFKEAIAIINDTVALAHAIAQDQQKPFRSLPENLTK